MTYATVLKTSVAALALSSCASTGSDSESADYRPPFVTAQTQIQAAAIPSNRGGAVTSVQEAEPQADTEEAADLRFDTVPRIGKKR